MLPEMIDLYYVAPPESMNLVQHGKAIIFDDWEYGKVFYFNRQDAGRYIRTLRNSKLFKLVNIAPAVGKKHEMS